MADRPTQLASPAPVFEPSRLKPVPENVFVTIDVQDMTAIAAQVHIKRAEADVKIAVVPARHKTFRSIVAGSVLLVVSWIAVQKLESKDLSSVLIAVAGAVGVVFVVREFRKKKD